jgi:hypothetical protein
MSTFLEMGATHAENFLEAIKTRRPAESGIDSAVRSDLMTQLADVAVRTKRILKWDAVAECVVGDPQASLLLNRKQRAPWGTIA